MASSGNGRASVSIPKLRVLALCAAGLAVAQPAPSNTVPDIEDRTRPFGKLCLVGEDCGGQVQAAPPVVDAAGRSGEEVYAAHCHVCHATGISDAPILGDDDAWGERLAKGAAELLRVTKAGLNLMPAMGTCMNCTDAELNAAIAHMTGASASPP